MKSFEMATTFAKEKESQRNTYDETKSIINDILTVVTTWLRSVDISPKEVHSILDSLRMEAGKIESLKNSLTRKKMKVTIFGPTSSGKSMLINAMLGKELLASGMGHTTNCFLQIEGLHNDDNHGDFANSTYFPLDLLHKPSEVGSHFIIRRSQFASQSTSNRAMSEREDVKIPLDITRLRNLSDATSETTLDISRHIEIFLAEDDHKCPLLTHYLQILDCPGISTCRDMGDKVKDFCGDADVHVLIVSTIAGISAETKEHFLKVKERLPNPDIIIGFTQWDLAANEKAERKQKVKSQHIKAAFDLLTSTGTISTIQEAEERCFFVSGSEALDAALGGQMKDVKGQEERLQSFKDFLKKIEERASIAGKKDKLDTDRIICREILISCLKLIDTMIAWIRQKMKNLKEEVKSIEQTNARLTEQTKKYMEENKRQREKALASVDEEIMECMDDVISRMETKLAGERRERARDSYFQEHGEAIIHDWYRRITKATNRTTRIACEDYSLALLQEYRKCFLEFPHEHPKAFIQALHEEILVQVGNKEINESMVGLLLKGVTDKGLVALFATSGKREESGEGSLRHVREKQRMAAGASVMFLRVRRWLWGTFEDKLLRRLRSESKYGLEDIKKPCKLAVEEFCNTTDAYYYNQLENSLTSQIRLELYNRSVKIDLLLKLNGPLKSYRDEIEGIYRNSL